MSSKNGARTPVTIVGAGPYGLSVAAHLRARGIEPRVFGEPMESWRERMPLGMYLKSTPSASSIAAPGGRCRLQHFRAAEGRPSGEDQHPVPVEEFISYGLWFQERCVPDLERERVERITRAGGGFRVTLASGESYDTDRVVMATGLGPYAHVPDTLRPLVEAGTASHTADHPDLAVFAGRRVAVLGAGQSALESAALLHEAGAEPVLVARTDELLFGDPPATDDPADRPLPVRLVKPASPLGPGWSLLAFAKGAAAYRYLPDPTRDHFLRTVLGPSGAWWLRDRVDGRIPQFTGCEVDTARGNGQGVRLDLRRTAGGGRQTVEAEHLLCATGYRVDVDRLTLLDADLRRSVQRNGTAPRLSAGLESSVPGLYFAGLSAAAGFGPVLRFVCGTGFAARRISAAVAQARTGSRPPARTPILSGLR
ncbi:hypothetical protein GCM10009665_35630 [Kitasatospora nipponensis]|uniref:FAD/NAD(P)-binding domain-containing protein n=1 Tax=Kitasatospora nipponensis TaxID=258049 RepID=A0ABN1WBZ3_9ACTN